MGAEKDQNVAQPDGAQAAPFPPRKLIERTSRGWAAQRGLRGFYERTGRDRKAGIVEALPDDYSFEGRRVLDFGCGSGRVLRQFLPQAASGEFWGCDLHRPTIAWLDEHLSPPLHFYVNGEIPMPHPDSYFDLVYAISVFTHITHEWSAWLLELHRILKPDGLLLATFIGPQAWGRSLSSPPDENGLGMCVQRLGQSLEYTSGARVLHSPWWLRSHWGRAFEILSLKSSGFVGQGFVLGRKRDIPVTRDDLERPDPEDPRELQALRRQFAILEDEAVERERARTTLPASISAKLRRRFARAGSQRGGRVSQLRHRALRRRR
jgi:SAM-dependent methyltransferase